MLLKWMNFHLKKAGYKKTVTNFSTDVKVCIVHLNIMHCHTQSEVLVLDNIEHVPYLHINHMFLQS
jgi:hypothetical protein